MRAGRHQHPPVGQGKAQQQMQPGRAPAHDLSHIGALCNDVAYGIAHAHTQRIRETLLRLNKTITGHRLARGAIFPGGAHIHAAPDPAQINNIAADLAEIVDIALGHSVVRKRFTGTAVLTRQQAADIGTLGYVAKASGRNYDARIAHPITDLGDLLTIHTFTQGDVLARFRIRAAEAQTAASIVGHRLRPALASRIAARTATPTSGYRTGVGTVEGWRGTITRRVEVGPGGLLTRVKIVDPSFFNWPALPVSLADTIVPDFPLANNSFNLSYAGNDLQPDAARTSYLKPKNKPAMTPMSCHTWPGQDSLTPHVDSSSAPRPRHAHGGRAGWAVSSALR